MRGTRSQLIVGGARFQELQRGHYSHSFNAVDSVGIFQSSSVFLAASDLSMRVVDKEH
jgi:hypothetical protein